MNLKVFFELGKGVLDRYNIKNPRFLGHSKEMKRKWNNKGFSRHPREECVGLLERYQIFLRVPLLVQ